MSINVPPPSSHPTASTIIYSMPNVYTGPSQGHLFIIASSRGPIKPEDMWENRFVLNEFLGVLNIQGCI
jgi:hypothetical protein